MPPRYLSLQLYCPSSLRDYDDADAVAAAADGDYDYYIMSIAVFILL